MVALIGIRNCYCYGEQAVEEQIVATFDKWEDAETYIEAAKLKSPRDWRYPFRVKSLLGGYVEAETREYYEAEHNPKIEL